MRRFLRARPGLQERTILPPCSAGRRGGAPTFRAMDPNHTGKRHEPHRPRIPGRKGVTFARSSTPTSSPPQSTGSWEVLVLSADRKPATNTSAPTLVGTSASHRSRARSSSLRNSPSAAHSRPTPFAKSRMDPNHTGKRHEPHRPGTQSTQACDTKRSGQRQKAYRPAAQGAPDRHSQSNLLSYSCYLEKG